MAGRCGLHLRSVDVDWNFGATQFWADLDFEPFELPGKWELFFSDLSLEIQAKSSTIHINILRREQKGLHYVDDIFKCINVNQNLHILIQISVKFVPDDLTDKKISLIQEMAWRQGNSLNLSQRINDPIWVSTDNY